MNIEKLVSIREQYRALLFDKIKSDRTLIRELAENMAECATNIHGQGYQAFIASREVFIDTLNRFEKEYDALFEKATK
jgi:hypothetical protein